MLDFEKLEKKYKKYRYKKFFYFFILVVLIVILSYGLYKFGSNAKIKNIVTNSKQIKELKIKNIKKNIENKRPKIKIETKVVKERVKKNIEIKKIKSKKNKCYTLQFLRSDKKYIYYINKKKRDLEKIGFDCYLEENNVNKEKIYLRCNKVASYADLKKYINLAEKNGISFFVVKENCNKSLIKKDKKVVLRKRTIASQRDNSVKERTNLNKQINENNRNNIKDFLKVKTVSIKELENLFEKRKTYDLAVKISQKYFNRKDFKNSLKWAKIANSINNEDEKSWILYSKSLYNLGDKKSATEILKVFLQYESSQNATKLLEKWTKNDN